MGCEEDGYAPVIEGDGRRGLWVRDRGSEVELVAGREGDDSYVGLHVGETVTAQMLQQLVAVLGDTRFADQSRADDTPTRAELLALVEEMDAAAYELLEQAQILEAEGFSAVDIRARRRVILPWRKRLTALLGGCDGE